MMLPAYIRAYDNAIAAVLALDTATDGDPDAKRALADVCKEYASAIDRDSIPDIDLLRAYSHILEDALDKALTPKEEPEPVPTVSKNETVHRPTAADLAVDVAKLEHETSSELVCTGPLAVREAEPDPEPAELEFGAVTKRAKRIDIIVEYVRANPGHTKTEIAEAIGCPHTGVYYPITKLVQQGHLRTVIGSKDGKIRYYATEGSE